MNFFCLNFFFVSKLKVYIYIRNWLIFFLVKLLSEKSWIIWSGNFCVEKFCVHKNFWVRILGEFVDFFSHCLDFLGLSSILFREFLWILSSHPPSLASYSFVWTEISWAIDLRSCCVCSVGEFRNCIFPIRILSVELRIVIFLSPQYIQKFWWARRTWPRACMIEFDCIYIHC